MIPPPRSKLLGEAAAIRVLAFSTLQGVSVADAKTAGAYSSDRMLECARPAILAEIQRHKTLGHHVTLLSGNLNPLIEPLGAKLDCVVVCTQCTVSASHHYTGGVLKEPMVGAPKAEHVQKHGEKHERHGYGNSHNDIAFLKHVGAAHVVAPGTVVTWRSCFPSVDPCMPYCTVDSRLRNHAKKARSSHRGRSSVSLWVALASDICFGFLGGLVHEFCDPGRVGRLLGVKHALLQPAKTRLAGGAAEKALAVTNVRGS